MWHVSRVALILLLGSAQPASGAFNEVVAGNFELSDAVSVKGGVLVADDELVGSVLFVPDDEMSKTGVIKATILKLERGRKESLPLGPFVRLFPVQDIEALASDGSETVFIMGSHSPKKGDRRSDREFLIQARFKSKKKEFDDVKLAQPILEKLEDALTHEGVDLGLNSKSVRNDLNIEGLAYNRDNLYIGFRSPLAKSKTAILCVGKASSFFEKGGQPVEVKLLDLGNRGIRGIAATDEGRLLVVAGPSGDDAEPLPAVFEYEPASDSCKLIYQFQPEEVATGNPEGLVLISGNWYVVFDADQEKPGSIERISIKED